VRTPQQSQASQHEPRRQDVDIGFRTTREDWYERNLLDHVLAFAEADLEGASPAAVHAYGRVLFEFVAWQYAFRPSRPASFQISDAPREMFGWGDVLRTAKTAERRRALVQRLSALQQQLRALITPTGTNIWRAEDDYPCTVLPIRTEAVVFVNTRGLTPSGLAAVLLASDFESAFFLAFARILHAHGDHLRRCAAAGCTRLFLRHRKQAFCSPRCSQRERSQRSYQKHRTARIRQARGLRRRAKTRTARKPAVR
jgi:hypothetical protein